VKRDRDEGDRRGPGPEGPSACLFVGEDGQAITGEDARRAVTAAGDARFLDPSVGILKVTRERWQAAQRYERNVWMNLASHADDDRNHEHARQFDGYAVLGGRRFESAIELGCGPFTNLRLLACACDVRACALLDPLLAEYRRHRHCTYRDGMVVLGENRRGRALGESPAGRVVRRILRRLRPALIFESVPVSEYLPTAIEDLEGVRSHDLVVMINVLEHCRDAAEVFACVLRITRPGSVFVFHDKLFSAQRVSENSRLRFDAGHPLRVDESVTRRFLADRFKPLLERYVRVSDSHDGVDLSENAVYFIGERT
jgi:SAM-dependent methyltransferase